MARVVYMKDFYIVDAMAADDLMIRWLLMSKGISSRCINRNSLKTEPILGLHPANERRRYFVTTSLIGWVQS